MENQLVQEVLDQLIPVKTWQLVRNAGPMTMQYMLLDGYFKAVQFTPYKDVWQVRLTAKGKDCV